MANEPEKRISRTARKRFWLSPLMLIMMAMALIIVLSFLVNAPQRLALSEADHEHLLLLARAQLDATASGNGQISVTESELSQALLRNGSAFVSISIDGILRGCMIDQFESHEPLYASVLRNTQLAAQADDRFPPMTPADLTAAHIEISVVHRIRTATYSSPEELVRQFSPFEDGVILRLDDEIATFLPSVWQTFPEPEEFLSQLCLKAGWAADRWRSRPYPVVQLYEVQAFAE